MIEGVGGATHSVEVGRPIDEGPSAAFFATEARPSQPQSQAPMTAGVAPSLSQAPQPAAMDKQGPAAATVEAAPSSSDAAAGSHSMARCVPRFEGLRNLQGAPCGAYQIIGNFEQWAVCLTDLYFNKL